MPIMSSASITVVGPSRTSSLLSPSACLFIHSLSGPSSCGGRLGPHRHRADNLSFYAIAHIFLETPGKQYCVWAYNASCTTGGMAGMPKLLGLHAHGSGSRAAFLWTLRGPDCRVRVALPSLEAGSWEKKATSAAGGFRPMSEVVRNRRECSEPLFHLVSKKC
jgi:hypothetical protein